MNIKKMNALILPAVAMALILPSCKGNKGEQQGKQQSATAGNVRQIVLGQFMEGQSQYV